MEELKRHKKHEAPQVEAETPVKAARPRKDESSLGISKKLNYAAYKTLNVCGKIVAGLGNAYEKLFVADTEEITKDFDKEQGIKFFEKGDWTKSLEFFESYISKGHGDDAELLFLMAQCHEKLEEFKEAVEYFKKAEEIKPEDADIMHALTGCLLDLEQYADATPYLTKLIEMTPDVADNYYNLGTCYEKTDKVEDAKAMYKKAIDINPRESVYYHALGFLYENSGDHKDAIVCFKKAMDLEKRKKD
ncbi:MAG: tetratricopeptide repeat protein [Candidatus Omnitrophica bacterium]|nr:tetratricopeptide repeat protein [Candidatus Omnitrophota bacterium]